MREEEEYGASDGHRKGNNSIQIVGHSLYSLIRYQYTSNVEMINFFDEDATMLILEVILRFALPLH